MAHTTAKEKHTKVVNSDFNKKIYFKELANHKASEHAKEHFYRKPYGKIGERGTCYGER